MFARRAAFNASTSARRQVSSEVTAGGVVEEEEVEEGPICMAAMASRMDANSLSVFSVLAAIRKSISRWRLSESIFAKDWFATKLLICVLKAAIWEAKTSERPPVAAASVLSLSSMRIC